MPNTFIHFRRSARLFAGILFSLFCVAGTSGCTAFQGLQNLVAYNDASNDFVMGWRNSVWARQAWHERKGQFAGESQYYDFGEGFRSGYEDVAGGGNGCPPGMAPRKYWTWKYQSPEGQAKVAAWFAGYPHGARAAEEDGAGLYQQIQISGAMERQYSPQFIEGFAVPAEEVPAGEQLPAAVPPAPLTTDTSLNVSSNNLMSRGITVYPANSAGPKPAMTNSIPGHVPSPANWSGVVQASASSPVAPANSPYSQQGVQQAWAIAR